MFRNTKEPIRLETKGGWHKVANEGYSEWHLIV